MVALRIDDGCFERFARMLMNCLVQGLLDVGDKVVR
jgi:hypothetical protein